MANSRQFRSKAESNVAEWFRSNGIKYEYESKTIAYTSSVPSGLCLACHENMVVQRRTYTPDFFLPKYNIHIEVKGRLDSPTRKKMRDVKRDNPDLDIRLFLLSDNKITKNKPERYSDWCKKFDYKFTVKEFPKEWFAAK